MIVLVSVIALNTSVFVAISEIDPMVGIYALGGFITGFSLWGGTIIIVVVVTGGGMGKREVRYLMLVLHRTKPLEDINYMQGSIPCPVILSLFSSVGRALVL